MSKKRGQVIQKKARLARAALPLPPPPCLPSFGIPFLRLCKYKASTSRRNKSERRTPSIVRLGRWISLQNHLVGEFGGKKESGGGFGHILHRYMFDILKDHKVNRG